MMRNILLEFCIKHRKDIILIGEIDPLLQKRLALEEYRIFNNVDDYREHRAEGNIAAAVVVVSELMEDDILLELIKYKVELPKPQEREWCFERCIESVDPIYADTQQEQETFNAEHSSGCQYCKGGNLFICRYDECTEALVDMNTGTVVDVDMAGHDYTDCRPRCRISEMTDGEQEPCPEGQTIYEKLGWTFAVKGKTPAIFQGKIVK